MIELSLQPQDFLFFKDTRPMLGSSPGQGAQLPMQHVLNGALHSALHRAFPEQGSLEGEKIHSSEEGSFRFGNLTSIGPFLSKSDSGDWYFPTPLDLCTNSGQISHFPLARKVNSSSLSSPLVHPVISSFPPTKERSTEELKKVIAPGDIQITVGGSQSSDERVKSGKVLEKTVEITGKTYYL